MSAHRFPRLARLALGLALAFTVTPVLAKAKPDNLVPAGKPVSCIQSTNIRNTNVRDDKTIDFIVGNKVYRNTLPNSCPSLGFEKRFLYKTSISQLCSVDIITVLYSGAPGLQRGASCGLGQFQPMVKALK
jgi:hypothetical protein